MSNIDDYYKAMGYSEGPTAEDRLQKQLDAMARQMETLTQSLAAMQQENKRLRQELTRQQQDRQREQRQREQRQRTPVVKMAPKVVRTPVVKMEKPMSPLDKLQDVRKNWSRLKGKHLAALTDKEVQRLMGIDDFSCYVKYCSAPYTFHDSKRLLRLIREEFDKNRNSCGIDERLYTEEVLKAMTGHDYYLYACRFGLYWQPMKAKQVWMKAAEMGDPDAQVVLSRVYAYGNSEWGVAKDMRLALRWLNKAVAHKEWLFQKSTDKQSINAETVAMYFQMFQESSTKALPEFAEAIKLLKEIAHPEAKCVLGYLYYNGWGVSVDVKTAKQYFKEALDFGGSSVYQDCQERLEQLRQEGY